MRSLSDIGSVLASVKRADEKTVEDLDWHSVSADFLRTVLPWRTFRWYQGQKHYSGIYWSATTRDHVIYESRLELGRLLFADFDPVVRHIIAQPFLLKAEIDGALRRHIPDYLLFTDNGPVVVDVKPQHRLEHPKVASSFAWTRKAVERRGWSYEIYSEPQSAELENVRFLAGFRRDWLFDVGILDALRALPLDGMTLGAAFKSLPDQPRPLLKAAVLHLLWSQHVITDQSRPLSAAHVLRKAA
ncbi:TnsA-like heteromeric transposase endonuclease subunit [Streptosporangium amethystogenes]|uniref:TnsA-like heteromeric transposase endonuclease subunit n=1 Tax=Streptosporangium amethystogenes TaxID=2002 RepID=UPI0004C9CA1D|nr:TnsA-like heteromeric transposase endonuclease subunit [Streptosporangium amethystogenes]